MRTIPVLIIAVYAALTPTICQARLGDTYEQCVARWGQPMPGGDSPQTGSATDTEVLFENGGYIITVLFLHGIVGEEAIFKVDKSSLSDTEKKTLLDSESAGSTWKRMDPTIEAYIRADGNAYCIYHTEGRATGFLFYTKEFYDAMQAKAN